MKKGTLYKVILVAALIGCMAIGTISAYFTDADTATNTFTVGKVSIDLQEKDWIPPENITPEQEFKKDPAIKNDGINDAYVFVEVVVPYANVVTVNENGTQNAAADIELFSYDLKSGWVEFDTPVKNMKDKTITHLYAYGTTSEMKAVSAGMTTESVFDFIKFANIAEDQSFEGTTLNVVVNGYAIQTTNLNDSKTNLDGNNADGVKSPKMVWTILSAQAPSTNVSTREDVNTDMKQQ